MSSATDELNFPTSMIHFPPLDEEGGETGKTIGQSNRIFDRLSNLFRPSSSNSNSSNSNLRVISTNEEAVQPENSEDSELIKDQEETTKELKSDEMEESKIQNGFTSTRSLMDYKKSQFIRYWMPDSSGTECYDCHEKFTTFRRRHHCRLCGRIFCKYCANRQANGTDFGYYGVLRLCNFCGDQMKLHVQSRKEQANNKVKPFSELELNGEFPTLNGANGDIQSEGSQTRKHSQFYLGPSEAELGLEHQINSVNESGQDTEELPDLSSDPPCQNRQQLEQMFEEKIEKVLDTLILKEQLDSFSWKELLLVLSRKVADRVNSLALDSQEIKNILDFIHIKKLHMDVDPNYELINGVAFSKSLANSHMPVSMKNVSMMLLNGTISYERVLEKFSSIEPIMQHEPQFFRLQTERVTSSHVSLLVSEHQVPVAALDLLQAEGISVIANLKGTVLKRIAEATNADILNSLDAQILQPRVGYALEFHQREYPTLNGTKRRIILFENCAGNFGPSILLKGRNLRELIAAKRILRFLMLARFSSKLEIAFLTLFNSTPKELASGKSTGTAFHCHICELNQRTHGNVDECSPREQSRFLRHFSRVQLKISPAIHVSPPYLETALGSRSPLIPYFKQPIFRFLTPRELSKLVASEEQKSNGFEALERVEEEKRAKNAELGHRMLQNNSSIHPHKLLNQNSWANFRSTSALYFRRKAELNRRAREEKLVKVDDLLFESQSENSQQLKSLARLDVLNPYNHQGIFFLFCANSRKVQNTHKFCMGPYVLNKIFYDPDKDISLGNFLQSYCFNPDYRCKGCDRSMHEHMRRIVHGNARVEISTHIVATNTISRNSSSAAIIGPFGAGVALGGLASDADNALPELPSSIPNKNCQQMICWLRCNNCSANSSIAPMPTAVFRLSFAKFVDYLTNGTHWVSPFPSSIDLHECLHCTFHSHSHFFALGNIVTCFNVTPVYPLNILFSPIPCALEKQEGMSSDEDFNVSLRDVVDAKGNNILDVGSLIGYALASQEYATKITAANQADGLEISHSGENVQYTVKVHFAEQFQQFRSLIFADGENRYIQSLARSSPWYPQGGKSGASFFRTDDERFVLKTLSRFELDYFKNCAQKVCDYLSIAAMEHKLTALCKIFGAYSINYTNKQSGQSIKNDYLVMEYIFYKKDIKQIWDLKGSLRNRFASTKPNTNFDSPSSSVLLDENYISDLWRNQMYLTAHSKAALSQAVINDSNFLASQGIMDYSLLAGVSRGQEDEIIIGIVDYMRTFTLDKKVESLMKTALPISNSPTVISPEQYCKRFYEAIDGYFAVSPDQWTSESSFN